MCIRDRLHGEENIIAYSRFTDEEQFVIIVNNRSELATITVPVWRAGLPEKGIMRRLDVYKRQQSGRNGDNV